MKELRPIKLDADARRISRAKHLVGAGKPLRLANEQKHVFSFVLWGTPGTGKTTLARIYAERALRDFYELSAVSAGKEDIRKIVSARAKRSVRAFYFSTKFIVSIKRSRISCCRSSKTANSSSSARRRKSEFRDYSRAAFASARVRFGRISAEEMTEIIDRSGYGLDEEAKIG
jgi:hypothetical protein